MVKNSYQIYNLLKILNKGRTLNGLKNIDEVYDGHVNVIDEIMYYHENRFQLQNLNSHDLKPQLKDDLNQAVDNSVLVNNNIENQGLLEQYLNRDESKENNEHVIKSTILAKKDA